MEPTKSNIMASINEVPTKMSVEITLEMVEQAYKSGQIKLGKNKTTMGNIVCFMPNPRSEYDWFYFDTGNQITGDLKKYKKRFSTYQIVELIYKQLEDMKKNPDMFDTEYEDYYWRLVNS